MLTGVLSKALFKSHLCITIPRYLCYLYYIELLFGWQDAGEGRIFLFKRCFSEGSFKYRFFDRAATVRLFPLLQVLWQIFLFSLITDSDQCLNIIFLRNFKQFPGFFKIKAGHR